MKKLLAAALVAALGCTAATAQPIDGWTFTGTADGDTVKFVASSFPAPIQKISVRILGIDTPETGHRAKCFDEKLKGTRAKKFLTQHLKQATTVQPVVTGWDKYGGRVLGDVLADGQSVKTLMITKGFAVSYDGGKKSEWCK